MLIDSNLAFSTYSLGVNNIIWEHFRLTAKKKMDNIIWATRRK